MTYDPVNNIHGLFTDYINTYLKIKQEASGWTPGCYDDASKDDYIRDYEEKEGIRLDRDRIKKNPGLRLVAKLCLNALWGKFGQNGNLPRAAVIRSYTELVSLLSNAEKEVGRVMLMNDTVALASWRLRGEADTSAPNSNVAIAAYTTAQARLKLYDYLEMLGERVLYYDTDSIIFVSREGEPEPPTGTMLGDLTDELVEYGEGAHIETFVSGGPKFYAYRVSNDAGQSVDVCKVKGIRLDSGNREQINFDSIVELIEKTPFSRPDSPSLPPETPIGPRDYLDDNDHDSDDDDDDDAADADHEYDINNDDDEAAEAAEAAAARPAEIEIENRRIRTTATHDIVTRSETKTCRVVLKKRRFITHEISVPFGYIKRRKM